MSAVLWPDGARRGFVDNVERNPVFEPWSFARGSFDA